MMKNSKFLKIYGLGLLFITSLAIASCSNNPIKDLNLIIQEEIEMPLYSTFQLEVDTSSLTEEITFKSVDEKIVTVSDDGLLTSLSSGKTYVYAVSGDYTDVVEVNVIETPIELDSFEISITEDSLLVADEISMEVNISPISYKNFVTFEVMYGKDVVKVIDNNLVALEPGKATIIGIIGNLYSNSIHVEVLDQNPYINIEKDEFYDNYKRAVSLKDSEYRTELNLMSGDITIQDQKPTIAEIQPSKEDALIRNLNETYLDDGNTYVVPDYTGTEDFSVFKGGAYITLEDVAAYIYAFGDIPANYTSSKSKSPANSPWGEYLRLNHSFFSGDTSKYKYEPELPRISGCGGDLEYYEIDIGTSGTDSDPSYIPEIYNDGNKITRGAARLVYARYVDGNKVNNVNDKYVFYTYNHYNDFQEYLNYKNGWGYLFGNISGGGKISTFDPDFPPTQYIPTVKGNLWIN